MKRIAAATVVAFALASAGGGSAAEWPGYRGTNRDAHSKDTDLLAEWPLTGPPLAWRAQGLGAGFSSVAVVGDRIYTMGDKDGAQHVIALDRADGVAARLIARANVLKSRSHYCNEDDVAAPDACVPALPGAQRDTADGALRLLQDNLAILVDLTGALDASSSGYGDPFNPGG